MKSNHLEKIHTVYIEGNVGVGKSTFLELVKSYLTNIQVEYEPHHLWQNVDGKDLLGMFFKDQKRWSFALQIYVLMTRVQQSKQANKHNYGRVELIERSEYSGRYCFAKNLYNMGFMSDVEWSIYKKYWDWQIQDNLSLPTGFIYLKSSAAVCFDRIKKRARSEEAPITMQYLTNLEKLHDSWLLDKKIDNNELAKVPVLVLDYNKDVLVDLEVQKEYMNKVQTFLHTIGAQ